MERPFSNISFILLYKMYLLKYLVTMFYDFSLPLHRRNTGLLSYRLQLQHFLHALLKHSGTYLKMEFKPHAYYQNDITFDDTTILSYIVNDFFYMLSFLLLTS